MKEDSKNGDTVLSRNNQTKWEILRTLRKNYHYSATEVGMNCGLSGDYINKIERGERPISIEVLDGYAKTFGVKTSTLMLLTEIQDDAFRKDGEIIPGAMLIKNAMLNLNNLVLYLETQKDSIMNDNGFVNAIKQRFQIMPAKKNVD